MSNPFGSSYCDKVPKENRTNFLHLKIIQVRTYTFFVSCPKDAATIRVGSDIFSDKKSWTSRSLKRYIKRRSRD